MVTFFMTSSGDSNRNFRDRFNAWWHGIDPLEAVKVGRRVRATAEAEPELPPADLSAWGPIHLRALEMIWGEGHVGPGGSDYPIHLVKPFALTDSHRLLDLGSGLGGTSVAIAERFGAFVTAYEAVPELLEESKRLFAKSKARGKLTALPFEPEETVFPRNGFDAVLAREALCMMPSKPSVMRTLYQTLNLYGQLCLTDFVLMKPGDPSDRVKKWAAQEPREVHLGHIEDYDQMFADLGLEIRIKEDISERYRGHVLSDFNRLTQKLQNTDRPKSRPEVLQLMMVDAERWARFSRLLEEGDVAVYRFFAIKEPKIR